MRKEPYTEIGIKRIPCAKCGKPSSQQWQICADDNQYRGACVQCDIRVNQLLLSFFNIPKRGEKIRRYIMKMSNN